MHRSLVSQLVAVTKDELHEGSLIGVKFNDGCGFFLSTAFVLVVFNLRAGFSGVISIFGFGIILGSFGF